ncbi:hypothetical protein CCAN2_1530017 [Capnocytophaga canimorsus]|nr:hypothetical protein CCAN2_1530017 [Capnocytophaga canimorsus]
MMISSFIWNPDQVLFQVGGIAIRYYSLMFVVAFALGFYLMKKIFINEGKSFRQVRLSFYLYRGGYISGGTFGALLFLRLEQLLQRPYY